MKKTDLMELYSSLAWCFDIMSTGEEHEQEAEFVRETIKAHKRSVGNRLLDVCCGHGWHDYYLKHDFDITGVDLNEPILENARKRNPEVRYLVGDVRDFDLGEGFDIVMCFDALEHLLTYEELEASLKNLYRHLVDSGVLMFHLDRLKETYVPFRVANWDQTSRDNVHVAYLDLEYDIDPDDGVAEGCIVLLIKEEGKDLDIRILEGQTGLFELARILKILDKLGLKTTLYSGEFDGSKHDEKSPLPVFVCTK